MENRFIHLCRLCGFSPMNPKNKRTVADLLGLSVRQIERYMNGAPLHPSAEKLLLAYQCGIIAGDSWAGFSISGDYLLNGNGEYWHVDDLRSRSLAVQRRRTVARRLKKSQLINQWQLLE
jgi:transcriptional regulator with XRE-family HTH domain